MLLEQAGIYEGIMQAGLRLSELPESQGGWAEYFAEDAGLAIKDEMLRAQTALMLENAKRWMATKCRKRLDEQGRLQVDEVTRSALVGGFSDYLFPVIRAGFPTNPVNDLISVQPTTRRTATVVYWNWIVGRGKGSYVQGQRLFDANRGKQDAGYNFSNEVIDAERVGTSDAGGVVAGPYTVTLERHDGGGVRPGTVKIVAGAQTVYDNGNGGWTGGIAGTMDYQTGIAVVTFAGAPAASSPIVATYRWDSEGSRLLPEVDVQIVTSTVETERRAIMLNYSQESMQDIMAEFGVALEPQLVSGCAEQMNYEIARQIIAQLWAVAPVVDTFQLSVPVGAAYNQQDHFKDIVYVLNKTSNSIHQQTQKGYGNWIVADQGASNIIQSLPAGMFVPAPRPANVQGMHFIGTLLGQWRVYKDIFLDREPGASVTGNILMGFKGTQFYEAGFVWSPYQLLYTTDALTTADFLTQKGMASRYATKMINPAMFARISIVP